MRRRYRLGASLAVGAVLVLAPMVALPAAAQAAAAKRTRTANSAIAGWARQFRSARRREGRVESSGLSAITPEKPDEIAARDRGGNGPPSKGPRVSSPSSARFLPAVGKVALLVSSDARNRALWAVQACGRIPQHGDAIRDRIRPGAGATADVHLPDRRAAQLPSDLHGRPPTSDGFDPSYYGHSVGSWEGDTLVVDTVGFNERGWIDAYGTPTTKQLHLIEKFTRLDFKTLRYEITIDDPGAYTAPLRPVC